MKPFHIRANNNAYASSFSACHLIAVQRENDPTACAQHFSSHSFHCLDENLLNILKYLPIFVVLIFPRGNLPTCENSAISNLKTGFAS